MNKLIISFCLLLTVLGTVESRISTDDSLYSVYVKKSFENKKLIVRMENMQANNVNLTIIDPRGAVIHRDRINTKLEKVKKYDLNKLEPGTYTMIIDDLMKVEKLAIKLTANGVDFGNAHAEITYKPTVWLNSDKTVDFNLMTLGKSADVFIKLDNKILYEAHFAHQTTVEKKFNLKSLASGKYTMVINTNGETFYRYLYL